MSVPKRKMMDFQEGMPPRLIPSDECFYAREYQSHGNYDVSDTNNLISNFKKKPRFKGTHSWKYKGRAILQCAEEFADIFLEGKEYTVAPIPTSKTNHD